MTSTYQSTMVQYGQQRKPRFGSESLPPIKRQKISDVVQNNPGFSLWETNRTVRPLLKCWNGFSGHLRILRREKESLEYFSDYLSINPEKLLCWAVLRATKTCQTAGTQWVPIGRNVLKCTPRWIKQDMWKLIYRQLVKNQLSYTSKYWKVQTGSFLSWPQQVANSAICHVTLKTSPQCSFQSLIWYR